MFWNKIGISSRFAILMIIVGVVLTDVNSAPSAKLHKKKPNFKLMFNHKRHFDPLFDEVNRCILACGKCAEDLLIPEETVIFLFILFLCLIIYFFN